MPAESTTYLDHNATSPMGAAVAARLAQLATTVYGNPDSLHFAGQSARVALEGARASLAAALGARPSEVVFTSGATEANAAALGSMAREAGDRAVLAVGCTEHPSVLETARALGVAGRIRVVELGCDGRGQVDPAAVRRALEEGATGVALMAANNETGVRHDVAAVAELVAEYGVPWHCDAVQALGRVALPAPRAATTAVSAHKVGGPRGLGALVIASGTPWHPMWRGGAQEGGRRSGTPDVAGAVLFSEVAAAARPGGPALRDELEVRICQRFPGSLVNGAGAPRLPNTLSVCLRGSDGEWVDGEWIVLALAEHGVAASTGAACSTGTGRPSHVLTAMGRTAEQAQASLRFSFGPDEDEGDVERAMGALVRAVSS